MFKHIPELSIWEISHYWHGYSPDETDSKRLPAEVQGTLRVLAAAGSKGSILRLPPDSLHAKFVGPIYLMLLALGLQWIANQAFLFRRFNKKVFDGLKIRREELARWCVENKTPLPAFWFPENEQVQKLNRVETLKKIAGNHLLFPVSSPGISIVHDVKEKIAPKPDKPPSSPENSQQVTAAELLHATRNGIINEFLDTVEGDIGKPEFNGSQAARDFYASLTEDKKLSLAQSPEKAKVMPFSERKENAVNTLTRAITAFKKGQRPINHPKARAS